jgi:hypothetical protein
VDKTNFKSKVCNYQLSTVPLEDQNQRFRTKAGRWSEGKIDQNNTIVPANIGRGGWYHLKLNEDSTVIFADPFTCGFGYERQGKWTLDAKNRSLTFKFSVKRGYLNSPGTANISETESYQIKKISSGELILVHFVDGQEKIMPFIKTEK